MDYQQAELKLTGRNKLRRKLANNTYLERHEDGSIAIRLHNTDVVTFISNGDTRLDSGGWRTPTTKDRINNYMPGGWRISQSNGQWYIGKHGKGYQWEEAGLFADGMLVLADGSLSGVVPLETVRENLKTRRRVQKYASSYIAAFRSGKVPAPSAGDCFFCGMREVGTNVPLGECSHNSDHLLLHLEEKYYVPSLLVRALEVMPSSISMKDTVARQWQDGEPSPWGDFIYTQLQKNLSRYILRQLGQAA